MIIFIEKKNCFCKEEKNIFLVQEWYIFFNECKLKANDYSIHISNIMQNPKFSIFPINLIRISYDMYSFVCKTQNKGWNFGWLLGLEDPNKLL